jgi:hypothetical protein
MIEDFPKEASQKPKLKGVINLFKESFGFLRENFKSIFSLLAFPIGFFILILDILYLLKQSSLKYSLFLSVLEFFLLALSILFFLLGSLALLIYLRDKKDIKDSYREALSLLPSFIPFFLLFLILFFGSLILGSIIPSLFLLSNSIENNKTLWFSLLSPLLLLLLFLVINILIWCSLSFAVFSFEGMKGFSAIWRGRELVKGKSWSTFWRLLPLWIILLIMDIFLPILAGWKVDFVHLSISTSLSTFFFLQIFALPFFFIYTYLIFSALRDLKSEIPFLSPSLWKKLAFVPVEILGTLVICFLIGFAIWRVFWGRDIPPIDDRDLILTKVEIPENENALLQLEKVYQEKSYPPLMQPGYEKEWQAYYKMQGRKGLKTAEARKFIENNEEFYKGVEMALNLPYFQEPELQDPTKINAMSYQGGSFQINSHLREIGRRCWVLSAFLHAQGKDKEAFDWALRTVKLGYIIAGNSPRPSFISYLVGDAIKPMGLYSFQEMIEDTKLPPDVLKNYARELLKYGEIEEGLKRAMKIEYIFYVNTFHYLEDLMNWKSQGRKMLEEYGGDNLFLYEIMALGERLLIMKPNKMREALARDISKVIKNMDKFYKDMELSKEAGEAMSAFPKEEENRSESFKEMLSTLFSENSFYKYLGLEMERNTYFRVLEIKCLDKFRVEGIACLIALKAYKEENGRLPDSLSELVPEYLPYLPLDPYDGKPLRYSREKKIIYCVGKDLRDNGGGPLKVKTESGWLRPALLSEMADPAFEIKF